MTVSAQEQNNVRVCARPAVPKGRHRLDKSRIARIHPRQLIDEDRLAFISTFGQRLLQKMKRLHPGRNTHRDLE